MDEPKYNLKTEDLIFTPNIASLLTDEQLVTLGSQVVKDFEADLLSRTAWDRKQEESMKLALQITESKNFPWAGASNIKFPLVTIAALQYHARAYPVLISGDAPVRCRVIGEDVDGSKTKRAERVGNYMSFQIMEEDESWEAETDKVLITQPIIGCAFKKTLYDGILGHVVSENVLAKDLVVNYWTKTLETAPRITHILYYSKNDIYARVVRGLWIDVGVERPPLPGVSTPSPLQTVQNKGQGTLPPQAQDKSTPYEILEQHTNIDFDGDGYEEPYIVYVRRDTRKIARIVARYFEDSIQYLDDDKDKDILSITPEHVFTKFPFIPSPDGGFYDLGFGCLLGPLNESINTIINQLVDAGTMSNTAGGFISRGIKMRSGNTSFAPLEWKHVDTTGDDLHKGIFPLPVREPSQVLFTLLSLLINYGERTGGAVDILVGQSPGQNTPAETSRTMAEEGKKVFNGIFKRTYRSLKQEFRKIYRLDQLHVSENKRYISEISGSGVILVEDFAGNSSDVRPAADPSITSDALRLQQAMTVQMAAASKPGLYNTYEAERRFLVALKVPDLDKLLPDPAGPNAIPAPPPDPKIQVETIRAETAKADQELQLKLGLLKLLKESELSQAKIQKLEAEALFIRTEADNLDQAQRIEQLNTLIAVEKHKREGIHQQIESMTKIYDSMKPDQGVPKP